jgi:transcription-repair coupling factor (superfamily II helicase)
VEIYRKLSEAQSVEEVKGVRAEVIDRFGALPQEAEDLLNFTCAKIAASHLGIARVSLQEELLTLQFSEDKKLGKKEIENMRAKIEFPLEFAADKAVRLLVRLEPAEKKKTRTVKNLLQRLWG